MLILENELRKLIREATASMNLPSELQGCKEFNKVSDAWVASGGGHTNSIAAARDVVNMLYNSGIIVSLDSDLYADSMLNWDSYGEITKNVKVVQTFKSALYKYSSKIGILTIDNKLYHCAHISVHPNNTAGTVQEKFYIIFVDDEAETSIDDSPEILSKISSNILQGKDLTYKVVSYPKINDLWNQWLRNEINQDQFIDAFNEKLLEMTKGKGTKFEGKIIDEHQTIVTTKGGASVYTPQPGPYKLHGMGAEAAPETAEEDMTLGMYLYQMKGQLAAGVSYDRRRETIGEAKVRRMIRKILSGR